MPDHLVDVLPGSDEGSGLLARRTSVAVVWGLISTTVDVAPTLAIGHVDLRG